jgi:hypothetical protein
MRASTIKGLIIHTADDLGNSGPDYKFGWGLMNAEAAAKQIRLHYYFPAAKKIVESVLNAVNTMETYTIVCNGNIPIKATLCWTDPPASAAIGLDNPSPRLINDLDLRIIEPNGSATYYPFVLNPRRPSDAATTGDNILDNVEQVLITSPRCPGTYTVQVSHKGTLTNNQQYYSLIISGQVQAEILPADLYMDGLINFLDLRIMLQNWLVENEPNVPGNMNGDNIVDFTDFAEFANYW